ncbi:MAG: MarR family transcriptional regulator [Gemmatimonadaceae bacterium]|nr:MarR family transcriptional regulator [Gemmatimonadaceae bacterium]
MSARKSANGSARRFARVHVVDDAEIGQEARASVDDHSAVRLWLRLFSCSAEIEQHIRSRLRERFDITLPRFDYLAQLERHPTGLRLNALSRYLMVTGGNVTVLTTQLIADGWVERLADPTDGRSTIVRLTPGGRRRFLRIAAEHEQWLVELLDGFDAPHRDALYAHLGRLRVHLASQRPASPSKKERAS